MNTDELTGAWDYASLPANVHLGTDSYLESKESFLRYFSEQQPGLVLGDRVAAHSWTRFSVEASGTVEVGDDSILVGCQFMCAERITLGRRVIVSYNVLIADSDFHPTEPEARRRDAEAVAPEGDRSRRPPLPTQAVTIDDDVRIGVGAMVLKGVHIGVGAVVAAGAVVTANVPPGAEVAGNPARVVAEDRGGR